MSDTRKIHPLIARSKRKEADLKARIKQKEADLKTCFRQEEADEKPASLLQLIADQLLEFYFENESQVHAQLRNLPNFIVDGKLFSFKRLKGYYIIVDEVEFTKQVTRKICLLKQDIHVRIDEYYESLIDIYVKIMANLWAILPKTLKSQKNNKRFKKKEKKIQETFQVLIMSIDSLADELQYDYAVLNQDLAVSFIRLVPQASNVDIAQHILNIHEFVTGTPPKDLPSLNTLRQDIGDLKRAIHEMLDE